MDRISIVLNRLLQFSGISFVRLHFGTTHSHYRRFHILIVLFPTVISEHQLQLRLIVSMYTE